MKITATGICKGTRTITGVKDGKQYSRHFLGLASEVDRGYGLSEEIGEIQVNESEMINVAPVANRLIDKTISVDVYIRAYVGKSGAAHNVMLSKNPNFQVHE